MSGCPGIDSAGFNHLFNLVTARFSHCKCTFVIIKESVG